MRPLPPLEEFFHQPVILHQPAGQHVRPLPSSLASSNGPPTQVSSSTMTLLPPSAILLSNSSPLLHFSNPIPIIQLHSQTTCSSILNYRLTCQPPAPSHHQQPHLKSATSHPESCRSKSP
ncbi:hypothetical protein HNY73_002320 [Argiope bruennichi]|uniref:Uncharacterized protein n=1 Tax=Argiope bruennichi TaxID=94029 RepID=A0A8T0FXF5_ARGBR|nr:hypothetical protein HNY73_002320 [Argiope bruennichi]